MSTKPLIILVAMLASLGHGPAQAAGEVAVFKDTVFARFGDDDRRLMMARVDEALNAPDGGPPLDWKNERSGASGTVTPLNRLTWQGLDCRRIKIVNRHKSQVGEGVYRFCEQPKGQWKLVGPDSGG